MCIPALASEAVHLRLAQASASIAQSLTLPILLSQRQAGGLGTAPQLTSIQEISTYTDGSHPRSLLLTAQIWFMVREQWHDFQARRNSAQEQSGHTLQVFSQP